MSAASPIMSALATGAGVATLGCVLGVAHVARRPVARPLPRTAALRAISVGVAPPRPRARRRGIATFVVALSLAAVGAPVLGVCAVATAPLIAVADRRRRAVARQRAIEAALPDAIELVVMCVHAGFTPARAIEIVPDFLAPVLRPGFAAVELQLHRGRGLSDALGELPRVLGPRARDLATAMATAERDGLPLGPVLDRLASDARAERRRQGEAAARRLPVRLSFPLVVCTLPSFVLLAIAPAVLGAFSTLRGSAP